MVNEETYLSERVGRENHFQVPEGYFDRFAEQLMQQLPERTAKKVALRKWLYAAASVAVVTVMALTLIPERQDEQQAVADTMTDSSYMEEAVDYAMMDNVEIYACLADN